MSFNQERYNQAKEIIERDLTIGKFKPYDYMKKYEKSIEIEDYESAKAITDILLQYGYDTKDTHNSIKSLNK